MTNSFIIGSTIEDSYISAGLVDLSTRQIVAGSLRRKRVNPQSAKDEIIDTWSKVFQEVAIYQAEGTMKIGMGIPGRVDYEEGLFMHNDRDRYGDLFQSNVKVLLSEKLNIQKSDIILLNDAASFFQGEVFGGAVRGYKKSFGITLGIGLGSARYVDGVVEDANLWNSPFKSAIAEDYLSTRWLINRFKQLSGIEVADLVEMKRFAPDERVQQVFDEFALNLAHFLIGVIERESPDVLLIGGHMESSNRFFYNKTVDAVSAAGYKTPIMRAILGEKAGIIGAASTWYSTAELHLK